MSGRRDSGPSSLTPPSSRSSVPWELAPFLVLIGGLAFTMFAGTLLAGLLSGNGLIPLSLGEILGVLKRLFVTPDVLSNPSAAWPKNKPLDAPAALVWGSLFAALLGWLALCAYAWNANNRRLSRRRVAQEGFSDEKMMERRKLTGEKAVAQAKRTRKSLQDVDTNAIDPYREAVMIGRNDMLPDRPEVFVQHRDGVMTEGPTGSGKTWGSVVPRVWDAPGFVLVTTTRADVLAATVEERAAMGRVEVMDLENITGWPQQLRWAIMGGCTDPKTAIRRANALVQAIPMDGTKNSSYWDGKAADLLRCYIHAAALEEKGMKEVRKWVIRRSNSTVLSILKAGDREDWADELEQILHSGSDSTDDMIGAAARVLAPLADPALMSMLDVPQSESVDLRELLFDGSHNTLYLHSSGKKTVSSAPYVSTLANEMHHLAYEESQRRPGLQLDPVMRMVLDEVNNVAPIPDLPSLITDSGGPGISIWAYVHNRLQNIARWGQTQGEMFTINSPVRVILPGLADPAELKSLEELSGPRREWVADATGHSTLQTRPVMYDSEIRTMDEGQAFMLPRAARPILLHVPSVWDFPDSKARVESSMRLFEDVRAGKKKVPGTGFQSSQKLIAPFTPWNGGRR
ncbi:type IV secretory system conjugative DNA transfer family protein [Tsukamurella ocularis]|uniref:type IV secretory system conjugative DNA transfer family protein n=1 Tax=Tsukamurella ocularis TaxID=1970234 RepID=UPI00216A7D3C|nr:TraM recognition domain-containing protein [Tsukamurella ocularis]MCS3779389.1 type IV secretory pathway TraG/TraD family ATPase VirD4 [Tsukamurella ocularis]MCS3789881.1 type IV secretory pathway TraG/TraD family ATPase VirD4 [Tsukamurella ocularis]